jgi:AcrR family transcriptional regulator
VDPSVKTRRYDSPARREQAERTRRAVVRAARRHFTRHGYAAQVSAIASSAKVSVDTVYTSVGRKPELMLAVIDSVLGNADDPVPALQRDYVQAFRAAPTAHQKLALYAEAMGRLMPQIAPLQAALAEASRSDPECARVWQHLKDRRADNMRMLAADLRTTGSLRGDLTDDEVADLVWVGNSLEYYTLLTERGWDSEHYAAHLLDLWARLLLE